MSDNIPYLKYAALGIFSLILGYAIYKSQSQKMIETGEFLDKNADDQIELKRDQAFERSKIISDVHYDVVMSLTKHENVFQGYNRVKFSLSDTSKDVFIDFKGHSVKYLKINGNDIDRATYGNEIYHNGTIKFPKEVLQESNVVDIRFVGTYRRDGNGLHRSVDPSDNEVYLYSQFEPFMANKCFPWFDQPDIKSTMRFHSFSPDYWKVISNEFETDVTNSKDLYTKFLDEIDCPIDIVDDFTEDDNAVYRKFQTTAKISSYLYAFVAGPYEYAKNNLPNAKEYVPMRIMARKSVMKYVTVDEFFKITMAGMSYYKDFFGVAYPFNKYDQIYVHEFNMGAMENVGCVTYTESYLYRGKVVPQNKKENLAITILHELAHMWFGNLVTMKWWDDLWLNESFATFLSHMALAYSKGLEDYTLSWELFMDDKMWGLRTDQFSTTHPIAADCHSTEDADNIFDGISYGKGASFLKQLVFFISEKAFRLGVQRYFKKFAYQNTELIDLITSLQEACDTLKLDIDLYSWWDSWIKTSGFNIIESEAKVSDGPNPKITEFNIHQSLAEHGENCLREQKIQICFFDDNFEVSKVFDVKIDAKEVTNIPELQGQDLPKAYLLNYNDWGYGKFMIDEKSLEAFTEGLSKIEYSLSRKMIYNTIFTMTRDAKLPGHKFTTTVRSQIASETNQDIMNDILFRSTHMILSYYVPIEYSELEFQKMVDFILYEILPQSTDGELKQILLSTIIGFSMTEEHKLMLKSWLENDKVAYDIKGKVTEIEDITITPENKYAILKKYSTSTKIDQKDIKQFVEDQLKDDENKDLVSKCRYSCEAAEYNPEVKQKFWDLIMQPKCDLPIHDQQAIMSTLMPKNQIDIIQPFIDDFFVKIIDIYKYRTRDDRDAVYYILSPDRYADDNLLQKYKDLLDNPESTKSLKQKVTDDVERIEKFIEGKKLYLDTVGSKLAANM